MSDPCFRCGYSPIEGCDGRGYLRLLSSDTDSVAKCGNMYIKELKQHLGPEIANCMHVARTPLVEGNPEGGEPLRDYTKTNLRILCPWRGLLPHLKCAFGLKGLSFRFRIVNDERIISVFVGSESYGQKSQKVRDDLATYNRLADFIGGDYDLVIIKLGYLGYKNRAAPGALKEALLHRESINKPTWLVQETEADKAWVHSYDESVGEYVDKHFMNFEIEPAEGVPTLKAEPPGIAAAEEDPPQSIDDLVEEEKPVPTPRRSPKPPPRPSVEYETSSSDLDITMPGDNKPERRGNWRSRR